MKQHKQLAFLLLIAMLLTLPACGQSEAPDDELYAAETIGENEKTARNGYINGDIYENDFFEIGIKLNSNWTYAAGDELDEENYDMLASSNDGLASISVQLENVTEEYKTVMTEEEYRDMSLSELETELEKAEAQDLVLESETVDFAGSSHAAVKVQMVLNNIDTYKLIIILKNGDYMATVTVTSYTEDMTAEFISMFYTVNK